MVQPSSSPSRRWRRVGLGAAAALVLVLLAWLGWQSLSARPAPVFSAVPSAPRDGWSLVQSQYCLRCHGMEFTHVGPGFAQIAQRYRGKPEALEHLARKIREGSAGVWGRKLMPRNPRISAQDAQAMAAWVLSQPDPSAQ